MSPPRTSIDLNFDFQTAFCPPVNLFRDISEAAFKRKRLSSLSQVIQSKYFWFSAADSSPLCGRSPVAGSIRNVDSFTREFNPGRNWKTPPGIPPIRTERDPSLQ